MTLRFLFLHVYTFIAPVTAFTAMGIAKIHGQTALSLDFELELKLVQDLDLDLGVEKSSFGALVSVDVA